MLKTSHSNPSEHPTRCGVAAVLAGGDGRRMGLDKTQMRVGSATLLERAVELAEAIADRVLVIGRTGVNGVGREVEAHPDHYPNVGPLGGIATALRLSHPAGCLVIPCDMPLLRRELLTRLIAAHEVASPDITLVVNPKRGWPEPLVGIYGARCLPLLEGAIAAGELAIWRIFERVQVHHLEVSPEEAEQLLNLNTPGDLTQLGT